MIYAHMSPEHLRADANLMSLPADQKVDPAGPDCPSETHPSASKITLVHNGFAPPLLQTAETGPKRGKGGPPKGCNFSNLEVVGVKGFEPSASCSQSRRATRLRYTP